MRKFIWILLNLALLGLLAACAGAATPVPTSPPPAAATQAPAPTLPATSAPPTAAATSAATTAPTTAATAAATAAATSAAGAATNTPSGAPAALRTPEQAALDAADGQKIGGTVSVLGTWGGSEQDSFMAMVAPFQSATGAQVQFTGTRDLNAVLTTQVQGGNPPDLAGLPGPGQMTEFGRQGKLVDLTGVLDINTYKQNYAQSWIDLGTVDGKLVGVFIKAATKGLIWYNPKVWQAQGFQVPKTWDELMSLSQRMAGTGTTPWCEGLESGAASGWAGTDWLEDIVVRQSGVETYNSWWQGNTTWSSPEITKAWQTWGQIAADPKMVYGGANTVLTTNFGDAGNGLFTNPPRCYMFHQASFITDFLVKGTPGIQPGTDFNFFPFPGFGNANDNNLVVAGDLFGMFRDTPQSRALLKYLVSPEAQDIWVKRGGAISPNKAVPLDTYPDVLSKQSAQLLTSAQTTVFDGSDLMPDAMQAAYYRAILDFVQNPNNLDSNLRNLDQVQKSSYRK
jgi:alpha-glucoside transport system substrate-binding protein